MYDPKYKGSGSARSRHAARMRVLFIAAGVFTCSIVYYVRNKFSETEPRPPSTQMHQMQLSDFHQLSAYGIEKRLVKFETLVGKVVLVVNVASECGFTAVNYQEFPHLTNTFGGDAFVIMAFPCDQFGSQEPGNAEQIKEFAAAHNFKGLLMSKVNVNGEGASDVFDYLKTASGDNSLIPWNFSKFLIRKDGSVAARYDHGMNPSKLIPKIKELLEE